ncbi:19981_t:CDS:2 [Funneliformis geosporum]|uniref:19981_t:CDS:1 n=1 Tax=Funneliformis geosporum TaxID=1117311 RepID=A0A9W4SWY5_9GLOM|nr:19981_t:CDS:2 [Funneliformis geosporum]
MNWVLLKLLIKTGKLPEISAINLRKIRQKIEEILRSYLQSGFRNRERITETLKRKKVILTKAQAEAIINEFLEQVKQALIRREELRFPGYLTLKTALQKPRVAMNLQTKKKMTIPAK